MPLFNKAFNKSEVKAIVKSLKGGKATGWDTIPNEFLINSPDTLIQLLTILFNLIKKTGA